MYDVPEPASREEALSGPNAADWRQAELEEFRSLVENQTWELEEVPPGVKPLPAL